MALEDGGRVDFTRLRQERRRASVRRHGCRRDSTPWSSVGSANVRYASGARQLWRSGAFPFAPVCVVVREHRDRSISCRSWDEGIPPEIGHEDLYGHVLEPGPPARRACGASPGWPTAHRVGPTPSPPSSARCSATVVPEAELADVSAALARARAHQDARRDRLHRRGGCRWPRPGSGRPRGGAASRGSPNAQLLGVYDEASPASARPHRPARAWPSPRPAGARCASATWPATDRSATTSWWSCHRAPSTPATREGVARTRASGAHPAAGDAGAGRPMPPGPRRPVGRLPAGQHRRRPLPGVGVDRGARARGGPGPRHRPRRRSCR